MKLTKGSDPICGSLGCADNHDPWDTRPEAFDLDNNKHSGEEVHSTQSMQAQRRSDPIYSSAGSPDDIRQQTFGLAQSDPTWSSAGSPEDWREGHNGHLAQRNQEPWTSTEWDGHEGANCASTGCLHKKADYNHKDSFFDAAQVSSDPTWSSAGSHADWREGHNGHMVQVSSDPICTSAGCPESKSLKKDNWPKDYPVPSFG